MVKLWSYLAKCIIFGIIYCRMRHGKVGLQLGAHQKYYISRSEESSSIQLTITVSRNDVTCVQERITLIDDVTKLLDGIMKVFMPAAQRPALFIPCAMCNKLHITIKQVRDGNTIFCPSSSSTDDKPLYNHYSDLLSAMGKEIIIISSCG